MSLFCFPLFLIQPGLLHSVIKINESVLLRGQGENVKMIDKKNINYLYLFVLPNSNNIITFFFCGFLLHFEMEHTMFLNQVNNLTFYFQDLLSVTIIKCKLFTVKVWHHNQLLPSQPTHVKSTWVELKSDPCSK